MKRVNGPFDRWELTDEEQLSARILTDAQRCHYQNLLTQAQEDRSNLLFSPAEPFKFAQAEAEYRGQIGMLQMLLNDSQSAQQELALLAGPVAGQQENLRF